MSGRKRFVPDQGHLQKLARRDWEEAGETEAEFYRRALLEIVGWEELVLNPCPRDWDNNQYGLSSCVETAKSALLGIEFNTDKRIAKLREIMADDEGAGGEGDDEG